MGSNRNPMLDGNGVKAMPGLITAPNPGSLIIEKKEIKSTVELGHNKLYGTVSICLL